MCAGRQTLRDMAADAVRRGDARWGAKLYEESLKKVVPAFRVHDSAYVRETAPPPIGSVQMMPASASSEPARIRKLPFHAPALDLVLARRDRDFRRVDLGHLPDASLASTGHFRLANEQNERGDVTVCEILRHTGLVLGDPLPGET
jgi:hypothetical protein